MNYDPPIAHILLAMRSVGITDTDNFSLADAQTILDQAGRFAAERIAPLNWIGDQNPARLENGMVITPPGWKETYQDWCAAGWNSLTGPPQFDGQGLPMVLAVACTELWNAASISFALCPLLTAGAIEAIAAHASDDLKQHYLPKLVSGEWTGTMNLTEPQSGSDLSQLRCKARRNDDGTYSITGNKIYITYGDHECASNIVHLVLARLDDAPEGTRGISLFLVPKYLPEGARNDLRCHSLEHKLGIHASPTCAMIYGDNGSAKGWLIGEENRGLACMFTMMNNARLLVGVQGVALAERATQAAISFAKERRQGRLSGVTDQSSAIIDHPDVKRMLLEMRAKTSAARALCMATAAAMDASAIATSDGEKQRYSAQASLLTPLAKSYATDIAVEVTSAAIQVYGGMGFIEETGVAQYYRDARILPIYEGTNGIQAIDLVTRKLMLDDGATFANELATCGNALVDFTDEDTTKQTIAIIVELAGVLNNKQNSAVALAAATPFLRAVAATIAGGYLAKSAIAARGTALENESQVNARFFIGVEIPTAISAAKASVAGAQLVLGAEFA